MISIDTKRLHLRNVSQNDVQAMFDYRNNETRQNCAPVGINPS